VAIVFAAGAVLRAVALPADDHTIDVWQTEQGLPDNSVTSLAQTPDGYLWFGTFRGLVRFDGVRFTVFDSRTPGLENDQVIRLFVDATGALWVSQVPGQLARHEHGRFTAFHREDGWPMLPCAFQGIADSGPGTLLLVTENGFAFRFDGKRFTPVLADPPPGSPARPAVETKDGQRLWIVADQRVGRVESNRWTEFIARGSGPLTHTTAISASKEGGVWVLDSGKLQRIREDGTVVQVREFAPLINACWMREDLSGELWIGTWGHGLRRVGLDGASETFSPKEGFPVEIARDSLKDREGNLWIATNGGGLVRLKRKRFQALVQDDPAPDHRYGPPITLGEDPDGRLIVGCLDGGAFRIEGARIVGPIEFAGREVGVGVWALATGSGGRRWSGTYGEGLARSGGAGPGWWSKPDGLPDRHVVALCEDRAGDLWIGTDRGLSRFDGRAFVNYSVRDGLLSDRITALALDPAGAVWIGSDANGLNRFQDGKIDRFTEGLPGCSVTSFLADPDGTLWIGTQHGLCLRRDGRFIRLDTVGELAGVGVTTILDDGLGDLWLGTNRGVFRVVRSGLEAFIRGTAAELVGVRYGTPDGLPSSQCAKGQPAGIRSRDGRLWFATTKGVAVVDPRRILANLVPPSVVIEEVTVDGVVIAAVPGSGNPLPREAKVGPGPRRLEIRYTGISLASPEQVRFRVRMEEFDEGWHDAGSLRVASYQGLPPGRYRFQVRAANQDGVWNETGASLAVVIGPEIWQTGWFRSGLAAAATGLLAFTYRRRVAAVERSRAAGHEFSRRLIETQEQERQQLAAELHDSLGQHLLAIKNRAEMALGRSADPERMKERVVQVSAMASLAIREVRSIAQGLRPFQIDALGLTKAVVAMAGSLADSSSIRLQTEVIELSGLLSAATEIQLYRILQECLSNAVRHSGATLVIVRIERVGGFVRASVQDDGTGLDPARAQTGSGLLGIQERARIVGGRMEIGSIPGEGTTVTVEVPVAWAGPGI